MVRNILHDGNENKPINIIKNSFQRIIETNNHLHLLHER